MHQSLCDTVVKSEERNSEGRHYKYELIMREGKQTHDWRLSLFSIRISMTDTDGKYSQKEAKDLFINRERALEFFDKLVKNLATPLNLGYVVEDEIRA